MCQCQSVESFNESPKSGGATHTSWMQLSLSVSNNSHYKARSCSTIHWPPYTGDGICVFWGPKQLLEQSGALEFLIFQDTSVQRGRPTLPFVRCTLYMSNLVPSNLMAGPHLQDMSLLQSVRMAKFTPFPCTPGTKTQITPDMRTPWKMKCKLYQREM